MYNILVFPAWTEIWLEIYRALSYSKDINLFWANSNIPNHAPFIFEKYFTISNTKDSENWIQEINEIIEKHSIDYIYPAYDDIIVLLAQHREKLKCKIIAPDLNVSEITRSKRKTYELFKATKLPIPTSYSINEIQSIKEFPIFIKPDIWQWSQWARKIDSFNTLHSLLDEYGENIIICENLPWDEFTVDCFSTKKDWVIFAWWRRRIRSKSGISMSSELVHKTEFIEYANIIHDKLKIIGAWFFQVKYDANWNLKLLEIAPRVSWTMATNRVLGINFPLLTIYEYEWIPTELIINPYDVYIDRALSNRYKINITYETIYVDLDDTIIIRWKLNHELISFLYKSINNWKKIVLITKNSSGNLALLLKKNRIFELFDEIIHIAKEDNKYKYIKDKNAIFIDDSFKERKEIFEKNNIPVFDLHMVESLL